MYFTFNNVTSTSKGLISQGFINPNPSIVKNTRQVGNRQYIGKMYFAPRDITVQVAYLGTSTADMYSKITDVSNWLASSTPQKLILSDDGTKYYKAVVTKLDVSKQISNRYFEASISFTCLDNCIYLVADDSVVWNPDDYL